MEVNSISAGLKHGILCKAHLSLSNRSSGNKCVFRRVCEIAKSDCQFRHVRLSVCPSVRMEKLGSHWTDIYEV